jgi:hypothetical protein
MVALGYLGPTQAANNDLVNQGYAQSLSAANLAQSVVDGLLTTGFAPYVTQAYVNTQAAANATKAYVDSGDASRLHISQVGVNSGAVGLTVAGKVDVSRVPLTSTQRYPKPFISPAAYNTGVVTAAGTEVQLYPITVADPMFNGVAGVPYKVLVHGLVEASTNTDGEYAIVRVRQGSTTGPVVAIGAGLGELYTAGIPTQYTGAGTYVYQIPTWAQTVDAIPLGAGGGGHGSFFISSYGGSAGSWATQTYSRGSSTTGTIFGPALSTLNITVGAGGLAGAAGGGNGGNGGPSQVSAPGLTTITAAGGTGGGGYIASGSSGAGVVTQSYDGQLYPGGAAQNTGSTGGNAPGGGGSSGTAGLSAAGGAGADGAVWLFAKPGISTPGGPVTIMPTAFNAQTAITGATTLYVMIVRSGTTSTQSATAFNPGLHVIPIPA